MEFSHYRKALFFSVDEVESVHTRLGANGLFAVKYVLVQTLNIFLVLVQVCISTEKIHSQ